MIHIAQRMQEDASLRVLRRSLCHVLQELGKTPDSLSKAFTARRKAETEVLWHAEAVARSHQNSVLRQSPAKLTGVGAARKPWKGRHAARGADPAKQIGMLREQPIEQGEIDLRGAAGAAVNDIAMLQRQCGQALAEHRA